MAAVASEAERFSGFSDEAIQFFLELQAEQSRTWFKAHQADFVRLWQRPFQLLVAELRACLRDVYPALAEAEPHVFRIQRDTRFARDKTPYKTYVAAHLPVVAVPAGRESHTLPGVYLSFGLDGEVVAAGSWHLPPELLGSYRAALDHPRRGAEIQRIVDALQGAGWQLSAMDTLKRVPPPYAADHPRAELLKRKGLAASISPADGLSSSPALVDWASQQLRAAAPLVRWLERTLA